MYSLVCRHVSVKLCGIYRIQEDEGGSHSLIPPAVSQYYCLPTAQDLQDLQNPDCGSSLYEQDKTRDVSCWRQGVAHFCFSSGAGDSGPVLLPRSVPHDQGVGGEVQGGRLQRVDLHQGRRSSPSSSVNCATSFSNGVLYLKNVISVSMRWDLGVRPHRHETEE